MKIVEYETPLSTSELAASIKPFGRDTYLAVYNTLNFQPDVFVEEVNKPDSPLMIVSTADGLVGKDFEDKNSKPSDGDYSRNTGFFDMHKDGLAYSQVPHLFLLQCQDAGTLDIPTFFVDTQQIIDQMDPEDVKKLEKLEMVLPKTNGKVYRHEIVKPHSQTGERVLYLASERVYIKPIDQHLSAVSARETTRVMETVFELATSLSQEHHWRSGQAVVFDNERLLHGRGLPKKEGIGSRDDTRRLIRIWMTPKNQREIFQKPSHGA